MKTLILFFLIVILKYSVFSQTEPEKMRFNYLGQNSIFLGTNLEEFHQRGFYLSWHWGNGKTITEAMKMSGSHVYSSGIDANKIAPNTDLIVNTPIFNSQADWTQFSPSFCYSICSLQITTPGVFQTRNEDPTKHVLGFKYISPNK